MRHNPGGKKFIPWPDGVKVSAIFGGDNEEYRYVLSFIWDKTLPLLMAVGMNPSVASKDFADPTLFKLYKIAKNNGYGGVIMVNTFAYRATYQKDLLNVVNPVGIKNNIYILKSANKVDNILMVYGTPKYKKLQKRGLEVSQLLRKNGYNLHVLKLSKKGIPCHPLYLFDISKLVQWKIL